MSVSVNLGLSVGLGRVEEQGPFSSILSPIDALCSYYALTLALNHILVAQGAPVSALTAAAASCWRQSDCASKRRPRI